MREALLSACAAWLFLLSSGARIAAQAQPSGARPRNVLFLTVT